MVSTASSASITSTPSRPPLRRWDELADLPDGTSFTRIFRAGQVLFGKRRAYQRKVAVADFDGVCSATSSCSSRRLRSCCPTSCRTSSSPTAFFDAALGHISRARCRRSTKWQELAKYEFALPPLDEQQDVIGELARYVQSHCDAESTPANASSDRCASTSSRDSLQSQTTCWVIALGGVPQRTADQARTTSPTASVLRPTDLYVDWRGRLRSLVHRLASRLRGRRARAHAGGTHPERTGPVCVEDSSRSRPVTRRSSVMA